MQHIKPNITYMYIQSIYAINNFAVSLAFMLYDMQHLKKKEEKKPCI